MPVTSDEHITHYVLIQPWSVYVKTAAYFVEQGGLKDDWGKNWIGVKANSIAHARELGQEIKRRQDNAE